MLIVISAPSGAGKTTLCHRLLQDFREKMDLSISCTTRKPRGSERDGVEYHFLTKEEFERRIETGDFAEWARVHDNYYGTLKETLERSFARGRSVLLDIDVQGAESLRRAYPDRSALIFIAPPSLEVLETRLRSRGTDAEATIQKRMANARGEMSRQPIFDRVVINDALDRAYRELHDYVAERIAADRASRPGQGGPA